MDRIDWNEIWKKSYGYDRDNSKREFWDAKAPKFRKKEKTSGEDSYEEQFYRLSGIAPGERIFDMGCGSGTLAIPFAKKGHHVWAADFSSEMLNYLMEGAREEGVEQLIHPVVLDWNEDWSKRDIPVCHVAMASRSLIFDDMTEALKKLESVASRRCCLGAWDGPETGYDRYVARAIGFERAGYGCHSIIMNELMERDVYPRLDYIFTPFRIDKFSTYEEGVEFLKGGFGGRLTEAQEESFLDYCRNHLKEKDEGYWQMDHGTTSSIAFISWDIKTPFDE